MKSIKSITLSFLGALLVVGCISTGCVFSKSATVTQNPNGTFSTNIVTTVNTNNLLLDCVVVQSLTASATTIAIEKAPGSLRTLQDVHVALTGVLNGSNPKSVMDILNAAGMSGDPALADEISPLVSAVSALEQTLLAKYGASNAGQVVIAITTAVDRGLKVGISNSGH